MKYLFFVPVARRPTISRQRGSSLIDEVEGKTPRLGDQLLDLVDEPICRRHFIATDVVEPDVAKRALFPITPVSNGELVPMAFRPEAMHRVGAVKIDR